MESCGSTQRFSNWDYKGYLEKFEKEKNIYKMCFRTFMAQNINKAFLFLFFCSHLPNLILLVHYV